METYAKLSSNLVTSSLWSTESLEAKVLWATMLSLKDSKGVVNGTIPGLARMAGIAIEDCEAAIERFQQPDKYSRTKDHEGRRIEEVDGGWRFLNHKRYRDEVSREKKKQRDRERIAQKRQEATGSDSRKESQVVADVAYTDTDTDTDKKEKQKEKAQQLASEFERFWKMVPRKQAKKDAERAYLTARKSHSCDHVEELAKAYYAQSQNGVELRYLKAPAAFLRQCLEDDPSEWLKNVRTSESNAMALVPGLPRVG